VITYRATLDVPRELAAFTAALLAAERRRRVTPRGSRKLTCFWQAVLGLRWFRDRTAIDALARDHGVSPATACRYVDEVIEVLAAEASELPAALERARAEGLAFVILDGKIIPADRCRDKTTSVKGEAVDLWYSGKAHRHGETSRPSSGPTGSRCGSRPPSRDRSTTSPPPASTPCQPSTAPQAWDCQPWPTPHTRAPGSASRSRCASLKTPRSGPGQPHQKRPPGVPALPRRARVRAAHSAMADPPAHHRQPQQDHQNHPRCPRPHPIRTWLHQMSTRDFAEITSMSRLSRYATTKSANRACCNPSGSESITCRLQEVRPRAPCALAAPMTQPTALTALAALGLSGAPFHETFHADGRRRSVTVTERSDRNPPQRRRNLTTWSNRTGQPPVRLSCPLRCRTKPYRIRAAPAAPLALRQRRALPWETSQGLGMSSY